VDDEPKAKPNISKEVQPQNSSQQKRRDIERVTVTKPFEPIVKATPKLANNIAAT
jgi:hypothetical protein